MYSIFYRESLFSSFTKKKCLSLLREEEICFCISRFREFSRFASLTRKDEREERRGEERRGEEKAGPPSSRGKEKGSGERFGMDPRLHGGKIFLYSCPHEGGDPVFLFPSRRDGIAKWEGGSEGNP